MGDYTWHVNRIRVGLYCYANLPPPTPRNQNRANRPSHPGRPCPLPGLFPCRPLRRNRHAPGAAESPPAERPGRHAGVRVRCGDDYRDELRGGADADVSGTDEVILYIEN